MKITEYQDDFIGSKFGIEFKISTNNAKFKHCSFDVSADGERYSICSSVSSDKGQSLGDFDPFMMDKYDMNQLVGIELFDALEDTLNDIIEGSIDYILEVHKQTTIEPFDIKCVGKLSSLLIGLCKKLDIPFTYPHKLKSKKAFKLACSNIYDALIAIQSTSECGNSFTISQHMIRPYRNDGFNFYENNIFVDAESYFNGSYIKALSDIEIKQKYECAKAEYKGKNLLMGLAHGDVAVNDFDAKTNK